MVFKMARALEMDRDPDNFRYSTPNQILRFIINLETKGWYKRKLDEDGYPCYYCIDDRYTRGKRNSDGSIQWHFTWRWNANFVLSLGWAFGGNSLSF